MMVEKEASTNFWPLWNVSTDHTGESCKLWQHFRWQPNCYGRAGKRKTKRLRCYWARFREERGWVVNWEGLEYTHNEDKWRWNGGQGKSALLERQQQNNECFLSETSWWISNSPSSLLQTNVHANCLLSVNSTITLVAQAWEMDSAVTLMPISHWILSIPLTRLQDPLPSLFMCPCLKSVLRIMSRFSYQSPR